MKLIASTTRKASLAYIVALITLLFILYVNQQHYGYRDIVRQFRSFLQENNAFSTSKNKLVSSGTEYIDLKSKAGIGAYGEETERIQDVGDYETALSRYVSLFIMALEDDDDGELWFARWNFLYSWANLGSVYPLAMEKLAEIRDQKETYILNGAEKVDDICTISSQFYLFMEVDDMNQMLKEDEKSLDLFKTLEKGRTRKIEQCWIIIEDLAFDKKEYELINRYVKDIETQYQNSFSDYIMYYGFELKHFNSNPFNDVSFEEGIRWTRNRFIKKSEGLVLLAEFNGDNDMAEKIRSRVAKVMFSKSEQLTFLAEKSNINWYKIKELAFQLKQYEVINRHIEDIEKEYQSVFLEYLRIFNEEDGEIFNRNVKHYRDSFTRKSERLVLLAEFNGNNSTAKKIRDNASKVLCANFEELALLAEKNGYEDAAVNIRNRTYIVLHNENNIIN